MQSHPCAPASLSTNPTAAASLHQLQTTPITNSSNAAQSNCSLILPTRTSPHPLPSSIPVAPFTPPCGGKTTLTHSYVALLKHTRRANKLYFMSYNSPNMWMSPSLQLNPTTKTPHQAALEPSYGMKTSGAESAPGHSMPGKCKRHLPCPMRPTPATYQQP